MSHNCGRDLNGETAKIVAVCKDKHKSEIEQAGEETYDLVIIGGGFSGLCTAYHVLTDERFRPSFRCAIVEPGERLGAGLAYGTDSPCHLLNVRAKGMSICESDPCSFVSWLEENAPEFTADNFVPRGIFRRYLTDCLTRAKSLKPADALSIYRDEVIAAEKESGPVPYRLELKSGISIHARSVVLAIGNIPPKSSFDTGALRSPWTIADYSKIRAMAIVGAGLTAIDVILEAEAGGFAGRYLVISSHGQFPKTHCEPHIPVPLELREWASDLASARPGLRRLLHEFQRKRKSGVHWEHLVDSLRKHSPAIWSSFGLRDKRLFLRHFRNLWNTHLHRSCCGSMGIVSRLRSEGRLEHIAGRVTGVETVSYGENSAVRLTLKSGSLPMLEADMAVNGTGLFSNILNTDSRLVAQLVEDRLARPDEFRLGFEVTREGELVTADGTVNDDFFVLGTLRRGAELECTAVPEIRRQVKRVIDRICNDGN